MGLDTVLGLAVWAGSWCLAISLKCLNTTKTRQKHSSNKTEIQFPDKQFTEATKWFYLKRWDYEKAIDT